MRLLLFIVYIIYSQTSFAQETNHTKLLTPLSEVEIDSVVTHYNISDPIPAYCSDAIYGALSYFPELKTSKIKFKEKKLNTTMNAKPTFCSLVFKKRDKRTYVVSINNGEKDSTIYMADVSYNAQVGVFAHEFCHFIDYNERSFFGVVGRIFDYTSTKKKRAFEQEIDRRTINRGLGWQLYEWSGYVLNEADINYKYLKLKHEIYLKPEEIEVIIESMTN